jgi:hypothetical protein
MMGMRKALPLLVLVAACGGKSTGTPSSQFIPGYTPAPVADGFTRFVLPPVKGIKAGDEAMWCQWVAAPADHDIDVLNVAGSQSAGGHHIIMYATTSNAPVGTSRACSDNDLVSLRYLGGIGGEGMNNVVAMLPEGVVFRLHKGQGLMANAHYVNYTKGTIDGQGVLDLKMVPADSTHTVASLFTNLDVDNILIKGNQMSTLDVSCTMQQDMSFLNFANHMHELGTTITTDLTRKDGTKTVLRTDPTWLPEYRFNPVFSTWTLDTPLVIKKGDVVHTHCEWSNDKAADVTFPSEMCVGFGFNVGDGAEINCIEGQWGE